MNTKITIYLFFWLHHGLWRGRSHSVLGGPIGAGLLALIGLPWGSSASAELLLGDCIVARWPRSSASLQLAPRPSGWNRHLWKILALGFSQQNGSPWPNRWGRPPMIKRWVHEENQEPASLAPQPAFLSGSQPPLCRRRVFPFHRTDPAVKAHRLQQRLPASPGRNRQATARMRGWWRNWRGQPEAPDSSISAPKAVCKTG